MLLEQTWIEDHANNIIKIYPIPASESVNIEFVSFLGSGEITILSMEGKTLHYQPSSGTNTESIDVSALSKGIYILKANFASVVITKTLIIE